MILRQPFTMDAGRLQVHLRVLATSDLHFHILAHDYFTDQPTAAPGLAAVVPLVHRLRAEAGLSLLLDNGDFLQGNPLADWAAAGGGAGSDPNPMVAAMNAAGYDAATLGNHEFNYGLAFLERALAAARFPVVSTNVLRIGADGTPEGTFLPPHVILTREVETDDGRRWPVRIGILGFVPPQIVAWDRQHLAGRIGARDIVEAAREEVPRLRAAGAEVVIALCHSGIGPAAHATGMENAAIPLAAVEGIDALVLGHTHGIFPGAARARTAAGVDPAAGTLHGKPAAMPGALGSHLAVIDLLLDRAGDRWRPVAHAAHALPVGAAPAPDPAVSAAVGRAHAAVLHEIRRPIGRTRRAIRSHFALVAPDAGITLVADAQRDRAAALLRGTRWEGMPILSAAAPFKAGGRAGVDNFLDIPAGPLSLRHAAELYPYPNGLVILSLSGEAVRLWLERSAALFARLVPGSADQPLIDPDLPSYGFDVIDGLTYEIDPSQPARTDATGAVADPQARRVGDIRLGGRPLDPGARVILATNSYRAGGGGGYAEAAAGEVLAEDPTPIRDILRDHVAAAGDRGIDPVARPTWRFAALPGTGAWFLSHPAAAATLPGDGPIRDAGPDRDGFRRYAIRF